jgi:ABC-2 type transport system ATP-binding protein
MIHVENLSKRYAGQAAPALDGVTLHIPRGSIFGLLGPNGAGKTTLISILVGLVPKGAGNVTFDGRDLDTDRRAIKSRIGFVPQDFAFYPMLSIGENLEFYAAAAGVPVKEQEARIASALRLAGLEGKQFRRADALSGGYKRRLNLAIGLLNNPSVLFLDEPTVGIDPQSRHFILDTIRALNRQGMTIIYTSHYMEEVQAICDEVAIIDQGRILIQGAIGDLLASRSPDQLQLGFGRPLSDEEQSALSEHFQARARGPAEFEIPGERGGDLLPAISDFVAARHLPLVRLRYGYGNLEDLFLSLTDSSVERES